jgi:hypothetical protein
MRVLVVYVICVLIGQALSVLLGLYLDSYSPSLALTTFIVIYFAMFWVAWRVALFVVDRPPTAKLAS